MKRIVLAGGCFWGVEAYFKRVEGVKDTRVGYIAGRTKAPSYEEVCAGSGHAEAVEITYDEEEVPLARLLAHYFNIVDATKKNRQGPDIGVQYRSGIYNYEKGDLPVIEAAIAKERARKRKPLHIEKRAEEVFYEAEEYHQDYLEKNPGGYCHIDLASVTRVKE